MYFIQELGAEAEQLKGVLSNKVKEFFSALQSTPVVVPAGTDPFTDSMRGKSVAIVVDGNFTARLNDKTITVVEEGDLIGVEQMSHEQSTNGSGISLTSDFGVRVEAYSISDVLLHISSAPTMARLWTDILSLTLQVHHMALHAATREHADPVPSVKQFSAGQDIILQSSSTSEIFTLLEGHAEVIVDGVKVGEILPDEIFGAVAAFSKSPRTATVRATKNCVVLSLPAEEFLGLMISRPATVTKLIQDMSRVLVASNKALTTKL